MQMSTDVLNGIDTVGRECFIDDVVMLPTSRHCRCRGGLGRCSAQLIGRIRALELAGAGEWDEDHLWRLGLHFSRTRRRWKWSQAHGAAGGGAAGAAAFV